MVHSTAIQIFYVFSEIVCNQPVHVSLEEKNLGVRSAALQIQNNSLSNHAVIKGNKIVL